MANELRSYALEWQGKLNNGQAGLPGMLSDPCFAGRYHQQSLDSTTKIITGRVVDAVAYTQCYRVLLDGGRGVLPCVSSAQTGLQAFGAKQLNTIPLGSTVWLLHSSELTYGVILCVEPPFSTDPGLLRSDQLHQSSRCGVQIDSAHYKLFELGGITDASAGRPLDSIPVGDAGWQAETGVRIWLDSFMAQLAVDESTGVFAFYHDQLLKIAGVNMVEFSAQHCRHRLEDCGELLDMSGHAVYPWEQYGAFKAGQLVTRDLSAEQTQLKQPYYSAKEPQTDDQMPFHRIQRYGGYVGQGGKRFLSIPPKNASSANTLSGSSKPQAVFNEQLGLSGNFAIRSAVGITLAKRPAIPLPIQKVLPEDPTGDTKDNYKASGKYGSGPDHKVSPSITGAGPDKGLQSAAAVLDLVAYEFSYDGTYPFLSHQKDWSVSSEAQTDMLTNQERIDFMKLQSAFYLQPPEPRMMTVDHIRGDVPYIPNSSLFKLLPDGGIVIHDGFGSSITMTGGHIILAAAGDIWMQSGRTLNLWAGKDTIIRSKGSCDISATDKDVRIKAEKNLHLLGGASGAAGGILLQADSPTVASYESKQGEDVVSGGIVLKAAKGAVQTLAKDIYQRIGGGDIAGGGMFVLDGNKGADGIVMHAKNFTKFLQQSDSTCFGADGNIKKVFFISDTSCLIDGITVINGQAVIKGDTLFDGSLTILGGKAGFEADNAVGKIRPEDAQKARESVSKLEKSIAETKTTGAANFKSLKTAIYETDRMGAADTIGSIKFTFRNQTQYGTTQARVYESLWQQLARETQAGATAWQEKSYNNTWPYPGERLHTSDGYVQQPLSMYDAQAGVSKDPAANASLYETPQLRSQLQTGLNSGYLIVG